MMTRRDALKLASAAIIPPNLRIRFAPAVTSRSFSERIYLHAQFAIGDPSLPVVAGIIAIDPVELTWAQVIPETRVPGLLDLRISPDRKHFASVRRVAGESNSSLIVGTLNGELEPKTIAEDLDNPIWLPDSESIVASRRSTRPEGGALVKTIRLKRDGSERRPIPFPSTDEATDSTSDGAWFVGYSHQPPMDKNKNWPIEIVAMRADGSERRVLASEIGKRFLFPRIAPDGTTVSYVQPRGVEPRALWVVSINGKGRTRLLESKEQTIMETCWSPDGRKVATILLARKDELGEALEYQLEIVNVVDGHRETFPLPTAFGLHSPNWL